ncbi:unnamed protein product, partial [Laminaria digitata]
KQPTLHAPRRTPHGTSRLVRAMSAWSMKTRRAPPRHCRDERVYGYTTTAMHDFEYTAPPSPQPHSHPTPLRHPRIFRPSSTRRLLLFCDTSDAPTHRRWGLQSPPPRLLVARRWLKYLSFLFYGFGGLLHNE